MKTCSSIFLRLLVAVLVAGNFNGCSLPMRRAATKDRAFIRYWPPPPESGERLRLAVKDLIDVKGVVTTAGSQYLAKNRAPASGDAECLTNARKRNVEIVGKTNLTEFAFGGSGINEYFGTPRNHFNGRRRLIPGGYQAARRLLLPTGWLTLALEPTRPDPSASQRLVVAFSA